MAEYIEGKRPILEAMRNGAPLAEILMADNLRQDSLTTDVLRKAKKNDVLVTKVPRKVLDEKSERGSHQGMMARTQGFPYVNLQEIVDAAAKKAEEEGHALVILLDHITDAGNLGAIARSAEVVGASGIVIPNKRSAHVTAATYKSSAGAISSMKVAQVSNLKQAMDRLKEEGFWIAGASEHAKENIWESNLKGKMGLIMGNEGNGLARLTQENCDFFVSLPQVGKTASLNVAQASTALMYEWLRQNYGNNPHA